MKRILVLICAVWFLLTMSGCVALLAGAAGGAGTAVWLSGKLSREVNASLEKTVQATRSALESLKLEVTKETIEQNVAQIISKYTDGRTVWIDVHRITEASSKVEVRVGASGDKVAADKILKRIVGYL